MTRSAACELLTIGHSNLAVDRFVALLKDAGVTAVADVRSVPFSRWCPWFSGKALAQRLAGEAIAYIALGDALGGRPRDPRLNRDGVADYDDGTTLKNRAATGEKSENRAKTRLYFCAEAVPVARGAFSEPGPCWIPPSPEVARALAARAWRRRGWLSLERPRPRP